MVERCGDRQRKFDGLEKWPFQVFIESLPIMLQIALLLLACALSRYMWSVNTSVARVVISFTVLGFLFFIGIVIAGTWSYECPFQTPASIGLRYLWGSRTAQKLLAKLSLYKDVSLIYAICRKARRLLVNLSLPNATSLIYAAWMDVRGVMFSREILISRIKSGIHSMVTRVGHQTIILLLRADRAVGNAKHRLVRGIRRFGRAGLLPTTVEDAHRHSLAPRNGPRLQIRVRDLESVRRKNVDNARCVCWVLRNITDPEAIDSAIRLAGTIRWFDGDPDLDPPFDLIASTFEACFDSTKRLYPGMRDRAYFSARAVLQIYTSARPQVQDLASKHRLPAVPSSSLQRTDPDLYHIFRVFKRNLRFRRPTFTFPNMGTSSHAHSLWVSNLLVDLIHAGPNPILQSYDDYLSAAVTDHQPMIANILIVWYVLLGGNVGEGAFWAVDKS